MALPPDAGLPRKAANLAAKWGAGARPPALNPALNPALVRARLSQVGSVPGLGRSRQARLQSGAGFGAL